MKTIHLKMLPLMVAFAWTTNPAWAAIESQLLNYGSASALQSGGTADLSYREFDPSLGQLTGVTIIFNTWDTAQAVVYSLNGSPVAYSGAEVMNGAETVNAFGFAVSTTSLTAGPFSGTTTGFYNVAGTGSPVHQTTSEAVQPADFSSFIGTGYGADTVSVGPATGMFSGTGSGSQVFFGGAFDSFGTIEIDYSYLPNVVAVPEAGHFPIVTATVAGLVGLGGLVRHIRRSAT